MSWWKNFSFRKKETKDLEPIDLKGLRRCSLSERHSLVSVDRFSRPYPRGSGLLQWFEGLPDILGGNALKEICRRIISSRKQRRPVVIGMGAHPIKVGLSPLIIQLMEEGLVSAIAMNGACIIHDAEIAMSGKTSEDVREALKAGEFGMAQETSQFLNGAIKMGHKEKMGLGEAVSRALYEAGFKFSDFSILYKSYQLKVPVTVHVALGTDIIHMAPEADGEALGFTSLLDFRRFCNIICGLDGGVYINLGSAVILPEVFLKAVTVARNMGFPLNNITTVTMDFLRQYRAETNVTVRPTSFGGKGFYLVGHHEIMFPLLVALLVELKHS